MSERRANPISELTRTPGDGYWIRVTVYVMFAIFALFFIIMMWVFMSS